MRKSSFHQTAVFHQPQGTARNVPIEFQLHPLYTSNTSPVLQPSLPIHPNLEQLICTMSPSTESSCHTNLPEHKLQLRCLVGWIHRYLKSQKQEFDHLFALNTLPPSRDPNRKVPPGLSHTQSLSSNTELKAHHHRDSTFTENISESCVCVEENNWK